MKLRRHRLERLQLVDWMVRRPRWIHRPGRRRDPHVHRNSRGQADFLPRVAGQAALAHANAQRWRRYRMQRALEHLEFRDWLLALPASCTLITAAQRRRLQVADPSWRARANAWCRQQMRLAQQDGRPIG